MENNIFNEITNMHNHIESMFNELFYGDKTPLTGLTFDNPNLIKRNEGFRIPTSNIQETEDLIVTTLEMPGVNKKDIELNILDHALEVKAENKLEKKSVHGYMASSSNFYKKIPLNMDIKQDGATAKFENGLLRIEIPKSKKIDNKNTIKIE